MGNGGKLHDTESDVTWHMSLLGKVWTPGGTVGGVIEPTGTGRASIHSRLGAMHACTRCPMGVGTDSFRGSYLGYPTRRKSF